MDKSNRPAKRTRLSTAAAFDNVPNIDEVRRQNDLKLQGRFQAIFDKYDRDFTGIADEIDIRTLEVVVDNGHLAGMQHERDIGDRRKKGGQATARRVVTENFENDELTSTAKNSETPAPLANRIVSALGTQDLRFDPYDPVSVAELGKNIALGLAQLMRNNGAPVSAPATHSRTIALTPPITDEGAMSPQAYFNSEPLPRIDSHITRTPLSKGKVAVAKAENFRSMWAASGSNTPEPEQAATNTSACADNESGSALRKRARQTQLWSQEERDLFLKLSADESLSRRNVALHFPLRTAKAVDQRFYNLEREKTRRQRSQGCEFQSASEKKMEHISTNAPMVGTFSKSSNGPTPILPTIESRSKDKLTSSRSRIGGTPSRSRAPEIVRSASTQLVESVLSQDNEAHHSAPVQCHSKRDMAGKFAPTAVMRNHLSSDVPGAAEQTNPRAKLRRKTDGEVGQTPQHPPLKVREQQAASAPVHEAKQHLRRVQKLSHVAIPCSELAATPTRSKRIEKSHVAPVTTNTATAPVNTAITRALESATSTAPAKKQLDSPSTPMAPQSHLKKPTKIVRDMATLKPPRKTQAVVPSKARASLVTTEDLGSDDELG